VVHVLAGVAAALPGIGPQAALTGGLAGVSVDVPAFDHLSPFVLVPAALLALGLAAAIGLVAARERRRAPTWGCGGELAAEAEYTATAFAKPLVMVFRDIYRPTREVSTVETAPYFASEVRYRSEIGAPFERHVYEPALRAVLAAAGGLRAGARRDAALVAGRTALTTNPLSVALFAAAQAIGFLLLAPLLRGLIKKMKAAFQLRQGPRFLQPYSDLRKLLRKEPVRSTTASWVFVAGPRVYFASAVVATSLVPAVLASAPLEWAGGILLLVGLLALGRFALATAALDTGSPFGGMGASREMTVGALAEPALMLALFTAGLSAGTLNLGELVRRGTERGTSIHPSELLAAAALCIVLLAEAGRVPVDNPATHLELTMIHEAMVLEYSGADLALVEWASAVKELLFMTLLAGLFLPIGIATSLQPQALAISCLALALKVFGLALLVVLVESTNAKLRFFRVPELMAVALGLGFLALAMRFF
jgi:formate hydrogenlyase subunit 4